MREYPDTQVVSTLLLLLFSPSRRRALERIRLPVIDFAEISTLGSSALRDLIALAEARAGTAAIIAMDAFIFFGLASFDLCVQNVLKDAVDFMLRFGV